MPDWVVELLTITPKFNINIVCPGPADIEDRYPPTIDDLEYGIIWVRLLCYCVCASICPPSCFVLTMAAAAEPNRHG